MQNLEDSAIAEATSSLSALGIVTGMTVNDSILFLRPDNGDDWWDALEGPGGTPCTSPRTQLHSREPRIRRPRV